MSIQIEWVEGERNIMQWRFSGQWTIDEFRYATMKTDEMLEDVERFDLVMNTLGAKTPRFPMSEFQRALNIPVEKRQMLVLVTEDLFIVSLLSVLRRMGAPNLSRDRMEIVKTMPEAIAFIRRLRGETMPELVGVLQPR